MLTTRLMYTMRFVRRHRGTVFCHTSVYLPPSVGELLEGEPTFTAAGATTTTTVIGALTARGVQLNGAEQLMTARAATALDQERLGCEAGHPLLHVERLYVDASGAAVEWAVSDFLPEHYTHRLHLGRRRNTSSSTTAERPPPKGTSL